ncbi:diguanylate cyclase/phosphodiesterase with GAF sensor [Rhodopseudomonas palustris HaA2]|uniref:Diguanylate cyclase/phosphodiesterase with GAF sensor n=1 Tax=Rhodopseudomonas palustris (strain HaA2) TaxID=316058 RepID=Q2J3Q8_RHOP2|nr:EAL domain-containing protein [Rhodopseudomonas palustris]ABD04902.1 diguanylate cyclase/phosphodiesterase with GAF sensor [Rhodopseudomonas palustris HaA2]
MISAPLPDNEQARLTALRRYDILDTPSEDCFDIFPRLVVRAIGVPSAVISFVDSERQWFKARINVTDQQTPRDIAFCAHAILRDRPLVVADATIDPRFHDNPLVTASGGVRFYAGAPIRTAEGFAIGVLCAIDKVPRLLGKAQLETLRELASLVADQLDLRLANRRLAREVAERERTENHLRSMSRTLELSNLRLDAALNNFLHGLCMFDGDRKVVVSNARFAGIYSLRPDEIRCGVSLSAIQSACRERGTFVESWSERRLGRCSDDISEVSSLQDGRTILVRCQPVAGGGWMTVHEDITERYRSEQQIAHMARHDLLTGLLNRGAFHERMDEACARLRRWGETFSVIMLDLDRFKLVNDSLGHPAGDALLRAVVSRLKACIRETDVLARLGGDEFAVLQTRTKDSYNEAVAFADRIVNCLIDPIEIDGHQLVISTSAGIALAPQHGTDSDELIKNADLALYRAKAAGRNGYVTFETAMKDRANARQQLEGELRQAILNREFDLYYQPQVEARSGRVIGAEALLRWRHPRRGFVPPSEFIPVAEETGLIEKLGEWVLKEAAAEAIRWPAPIKLAINLSPVQLSRGNLTDTVTQALRLSGLPPERLEVEITENVFLEDEVNNLAVIRQLRSLGVSVALDDFGTGYSSLSYLTRFPFDQIKIDKFFSMNLIERSDCATIVSSVITLARGLGISTVAEGVETVRQFELLREAGVDYFQGYLFGHPVPASALNFGAAHDITRITEVA